MPSLTVVPENWVQGKCVYWPPNGLVLLSKNQESVPDKQSWKKQSCKLVGHAKTYQQGEDVIGVLDKITDSEDALQMDRGTRTNPAKKRSKFQSKSYQLAPPRCLKNGVAVWSVYGRAGRGGEKFIFSANCKQTHWLSHTKIQHGRSMNLTHENTYLYSPWAPPAAEPVSDIHAPGSSGNIITNASASHVKPTQTSMTDYPSMQFQQPLDMDSLQLSTPPAVPNPVMHHAIQPMVTDPKVLHVQAVPNTSQQSNLTGYNPIDKVAEQELPVFMGNDGKQYAKLANGYFMELSNNQDSTHDPELADGVNSTGELQSNPETSISMELRKINDRLDVIEGILSQLMNFMANFDKFMQMRNKDDAIPSTCQQNEDFSEFEGLSKIDSDDSLKALEQSLANPTFADRYFRYFHTMFSLNGKRESAPFFRKIIRKLVTPVVFLPYSWKGNKRAKNSSSSDTGKHISFEASFPEFIKFIHRLVHAADLSHTREHNETLFKDYLRYKNTEFKRFQQGYGDHRASSTRKRRQPTVTKKEDGEEIPRTSSKRRRSSSHGSGSTSSHGSGSTSSEQLSEDGNGSKTSVEENSNGSKTSLEEEQLAD